MRRTHKCRRAICHVNFPAIPESIIEENEEEENENVDNQLTIDDWQMAKQNRHRQSDLRKQMTKFGKQINQQLGKVGEISAGGLQELNSLEGKIHCKVGQLIEKLNAIDKNSAASSASSREPNLTSLEPISLPPVAHRNHPHRSDRDRGNQKSPVVITVTEPVASSSKAFRKKQPTYYFFDDNVKPLSSASAAAHSSQIKTTEESYSHSFSSSILKSSLRAINKTFNFSETAEELKEQEKTRSSKRLKLDDGEKGEHEVLEIRPPYYNSNDCKSVFANNAIKHGLKSPAVVRNLFPESLPITCSDVSASTDGTIRQSDSLSSSTTTFYSCSDYFQELNDDDNGDTGNDLEKDVTRITNMTINLGINDSPYDSDAAGTTFIVDENDNQGEYFYDKSTIRISSCSSGHGSATTSTTTTSDHKILHETYAISELEEVEEGNAHRAKKRIPRWVKGENLSYELWYQGPQLYNQFTNTISTSNNMDPIFPSKIGMLPIFK